MKSELSGIFWVKMIAENILLGIPGTHSMHMSVKRIARDTKYFSKILLKICERVDF